MSLFEGKTKNLRTNIWTDWKQLELIEKEEDIFKIFYGFGTSYFKQQNFPFLIISHINKITNKGILYKYHLNENGNILKYNVILKESAIICFNNVARGYIFKL